MTAELTLAVSATLPRPGLTATNALYFIYTWRSARLIIITDNILAA
jgi:hypothetical protein